jgi:polyhydroxyalkanoate synthase
VGAHNDNHYVDPDTWLATATAKPGSWWLEWAEWLDRQASGARANAPREAGSAKCRPLGDAPGTYVLVE